MTNEGGIRRLVWLPKETDHTIRIISEALGMSNSAFIRFTIHQYFEKHGVQALKINAVKPEIVERVIQKLTDRSIEGKAPSERERSRTDRSVQGQQ